LSGIILSVPILISQQSELIASYSGGALKSALGSNIGLISIGTNSKNNKTISGAAQWK
jgi:hypothetical protein